jgi:hypothetical protein
MAFYECSSLTKVTICEGVTEIGERAFEQCELLREISLPDSLETIHKDILRYCNSLERIEVGPKLFADKEHLKDIFSVQLYKLIVERQA